MSEPEPNSISWEDKVGLHDDTTYVALYPSESHADLWMDEADEQGYKSRSRYLYELIQEARQKRKGKLETRDSTSKQVQELEGEIDQLEAKLEETRQSTTLDVNVVDAGSVESALTETYQPLSDLVATVLETNEVSHRITSGVEDRLFELAKENSVEYKSGFGWRLISERNQ